MIKEQSLQVGVCKGRCVKRAQQNQTWIMKNTLDNVNVKRKCVSLVDAGDLMQFFSTFSANVGICTNICSTWIPSRFQCALSGATFAPNIAFTLLNWLQSAIIVILPQLLSKTFRQTIWASLAKHFRVWFRLALKETSLRSKTPA